MSVKKYRSKIVNISNPVDGIYTVEFESLDGRFRYLPGQFLHLAIDEAYDGVGQWPDSRCFSIQSHPDSDTIKITYSVKGKFTRMMAGFFETGRTVWLKLPFGDLFSQPHSMKNTVFIAGGTGLTPFLSLFTHRSFSEYTTPHIFLGFRTAYHNVFKSELESMAGMDITLLYETVEGPLNIQHIFDLNGIDNDYFISGPPLMISDFRSTLIHNGVHISKIHTDQWE